MQLHTKMRSCKRTGTQSETHSDIEVALELLLDLGLECIHLLLREVVHNELGIPQPFADAHRIDERVLCARACMRGEHACA